MSSVFDIVGPIMVGPSSSHTAGAVKLGQLARAIFDKTPDKVTFILHGSFATVYKGHATDRALLAGIMKFRTSDPRIKEAFEIAKQKGIKYEFQLSHLGSNVHPNTVKMILEAKGHKKMSIVGSSIGGGAVRIRKIDGYRVDIKGVAGKYFTLLIVHKNTPGVLAEITNYLSSQNINIAGLQSEEFADGGKALTLVNLDSKLTLDDVLKLEKLPHIYYARSLHKIT